MATGKAYTREFKEEAVRLTVSSGKSVALVTKDLGVPLNTLHSWRAQARGERRLPVSENETLEQKIKRLERGLRMVTDQRDIINNYRAAARILLP